MIKANEIIIGRLFNVPREDQSPFRIDTIEYLSGGFGKVGMYPTIDGKIRDDMHPLTWYIEHLSPIPLTPKWLERFGFKCRDSANSFDWHIGLNNITHDWLFYIRWIKGRQYPFYNNSRHTIKYVHQLQNLYFSLTGEELTLTTPEGGKKEGE